MTKDQQNNQQRGQQVVFNITTPNAESFMNSESQIASRAIRMLRQAGRNT
jgi:hypothetical protein